MMFNFHSIIADQLENRYPNLDAFILKFELGFLTLIFHPESTKVVPVFVRDSEEENQEIIISDFTLKCKDQPGRVDLSFKMTQKSDDFIKTICHNFEDIPMKLYQIKAIVDPVPLKDQP